MKQINGTFTLAFVEEDNKQRVIFRVVPLITREGVAFRNAVDVFPDEASLRVVPDKREQSTFKERMRAMGNLCVIDLSCSEGKELFKVRQNKNYDPALGEMNQFAIYSDVILEFAPGAAFEVLEWQGHGTSFPVEGILTEEVLLLYNKVLYGPLPRQDLSTVSMEGLKPFGNDRFLLHTVELPGHQAHTIYWNPEETINWRQRRGSLRRKGDQAQHADEEEEIKTGEAPFLEMQKTVVETASKRVPRKERHTVPVTDDLGLFVEKQEAAATQVENHDEPLPIGTKLEILTPHVSFDEQISRLDQPISRNANRLAMKRAVHLEDLREAANRFAGTPLVRDAITISKNVSHPEPLHYVVEHQLRVSHEDRTGAELMNVQFHRLENPVENLLMAMEQVWQDQEAWVQAIGILADNEGFTQSILEALHRKGHDVSAVAIAYKQLEELEAERLHVLLQIDKAQADRKQFQDELLTNVTGKKREELTRLTQALEAAKEKVKELEGLLVALSAQVQSKISGLLAARLSCFGGVSEEKVLISPVMGKHHQVIDMVQCVHNRMNARGFALTEDDVLSLLIVFSQFPSFCLHANSVGDAQLFATTLLEALCLQSCSATVRPGVMVQVASLFTEDERRTPTVTLQLLGTEALSIFGHRTIFLSCTKLNAERLDGSLQPYPVILVPAIQPHGWKADVSPVALQTPTALSSFLDLSAEASPLLDEGKKWLEEIKNRFSATNVPISDAMWVNMLGFLSVACQKSSGGFLDAADRAMNQWVVPKLMTQQYEAEKVLAVFKGLPRSLESLTMKMFTTL